ncbi:hypothetical protein T12_13789 [Trichinella patagoniensis]|uniref:SCAN domain-containing protein 3 n=1 Tax=Trichinella patagoniensis TaxID=990121 RepID=A0A0V1A0J7_9BILA|nr:hypothetical protein T12_13789 [Trichinella patagoniensis]
MPINSAMKALKMKDHIERVHPYKKTKDTEFIKVLKQKFRNQLNLKTFLKAPYIPLSAKTVQRRIDELASDLEKTLVMQKE